MRSETSSLMDEEVDRLGPDFNLGARRLNEGRAVYVPRGPQLAKWTHGLQGLLLSWIVLSLAFGIRYLRYGYFDLFIWSAVGVGTGFIFHELAHRETAKRFGCIAEYVLWPTGLALALLLSLITLGRFVFAAPGAVMFTCPYLYRRSGMNFAVKRSGDVETYVAAAGPLSNMIIGFVSNALYNTTGYWPLYMISSINWYLAVFNLLPLDPLDGAKVFRGSIMLWILMFTVSAFFTFMV
jgi:Zn-dependent protease